LLSNFGTLDSRLDRWRRAERSGFTPGLERRTQAR